MLFWLLLLQIANDPRALQSRGEDHFRAGRVTEAVADFDQVIKLQPQMAPHHWQRGLALYYVGRYEDCAKQFETHRTVNPEDVENAVWHYACVARWKSKDEARKRYIPVSADDRVPMKQVHLLFAGKATPDSVSNAGGDPTARMYGHLYLGLWLETEGRAKESLEEMKKAVAINLPDNYMWATAHVHVKMRERN